MTQGARGGRITRDDLEAAFTRVLGEGEASAQSAAPALLLVAGTLALGVVMVAYLAGRRRGRRRSTVVELRRI
jgi:hypothetical protein